MHEMVGNTADKSVLNLMRFMLSDRAYILNIFLSFNSIFPQKVPLKVAYMENLSIVPNKLFLKNILTIDLMALVL